MIPYYTVKYRPAGAIFWRRLRRVVGDGLVESAGSRYFMLDDNRRVEIPVTAEIVFARERLESIRQKMSKEAGQQIPAGGAR